MLKSAIGGAGIPSFTATGFGIEVAEGKETREIDGRMYVLEPSLTADFAYVKAWKGDKYGNLIFKGTARNFNPVMAMAGKITIAEVEELVEPGGISIPTLFILLAFLSSAFLKGWIMKTY